MLADQLDYLVGVDPHRDSHALAVVQVVSGVVLFEAAVDASSDGTPRTRTAAGDLTNIEASLAHLPAFAGVTAEHWRRREWAAEGMVRRRCPSPRSPRDFCCRERLALLSQTASIPAAPS